MAEREGERSVTELWEQARKVLCVRLDALGDVLMTTPALRAIKESGCGRHVTLLTSPAGAQVARYVSEIDDILVYDAPWMKATSRRTDSQPEYAIAERLRATGFDAAVVFTVYSQNPLPAAFLCYLANIPLRLAHCHENPYQLLTSWVPDPEPERYVRHEVERQLELVAAVGYHTEDERMSLQVPAGATGRVRAVLAENGIELDRPWVVIHPGATAASRRYPPERFADAASRLAGEFQFQVVLTGTAGERDLIVQIQKQMAEPARSLAGKLSFEEMAALLKLAPILISNNTGPVHMAAALGTPVIDLYALTNPQHTPWAVPHRLLFHDVPCRYCYKSICPHGHNDCLRRVDPDAVVRATVELFEETAALTACSARPGRAWRQVLPPLRSL